jgi:hypothetical protein
VVSDDIEARLASLEARVAALEPQPAVVKFTSCLLNNPDSASCEGASLYHRRQGCQGTACAIKSSEYYKAYRERVAREATDE